MYPDPEDPDVLMWTIRSLREDAQQYAGQDCTPIDPRPLMANHYAAIQEGKKHRNQDPSILVRVDVYEPYLPCTKALDELKLMEISELKRETHRRGKFLMVRQMGEHSRGIIHITGVVRDIQGSYENLNFDAADIALPERHIMALNAVPVIREPYYTIHQYPRDVICINHPSDLIYLPITDPRVPSSLLNREEAGWKQRRTALQWKEAGNAALEAGRNLDAAAWYSCGILVVSTSELELKKTLYRNRAQANLKLKRFDAAEADALAALQSGGEDCRDVDYKAHFQAGLAAYSIRDFARAPLDLRSWLATHYSITSQLSKWLAANKTLFELLALDKIVLTETHVELVPGEFSGMHVGAAMALGFLSRLLGVKGKVEVAGQYEREYRTWCLVLSGVMNGSSF